MLQGGSGGGAEPAVAVRAAVSKAWALARELYRQVVWEVDEQRSTLSSAGATAPPPRLCDGAKCCQHRQTRGAGECDGAK
jgi:hypothetical protein|eukprot:SAG25_NODE_417_length_8250_cov_7.720157_8_plen_80_part_00